MEPSFRVITIDKEIKFNKSDLEPLKNTECKHGKESDNYRICNISNDQYSLELCPNGHGDDIRGQTCRGQTWLYLHIKLGNAIKVETDVDIFIDSVGYSTKIKYEYAESIGWGDQVCTTEELFDTTKKFFVIGEMIIKVKGTMKIYLPANIIVYPFSAKWKIKEKELESLKTSTDVKKDYLWSEDLKLAPNSDIEYYLGIFPNGDEEEGRGKATISFHLKLGSAKNVKAVYNFSIHSANYSHDSHNIFEDEKIGGWNITICSTEDLFKPENGYFIDGEMLIKVSGTITIQKEENNSNEMEWEENTVPKDSAADDDKDFTIFVGEKSIKVHKQLLIDSSSYFVALFNSGMIEAKEMKTTITDFDYDIVEAGIQILYDPKIPSNFSFEQLLEVLRFSDKYVIGIIKDLIENHSIAQISPTNVCNLINYATTTVSAPKLHAKCVEYIIRRSKESNAILGLETLDKDLLLKIFVETFDKNF